MTGDTIREAQEKFANTIAQDPAGEQVLRARSGIGAPPSCVVK